MFGNAPYPVSVPAVFGGDDYGVPVRWVQLVWQRTDPMPYDSVLEEIRFNYDNRFGEDSPDNPIYLKESISSVPALNSRGVLILALLIISSTAWFIRRIVFHS